MLFNPIFINPQKFLSTPETSGVKQNKLSYLFSDIIKNSLGVKNQANESNLETVAISNIVADHVTKENLKVNSTVELTHAEKSIISELNTILANFNNSEVTTDNKSETVKIENTDHKEIKIIGDDESVSQLLNGLISLVEKHDLQIVTSEKELPENLIKEFKGSDLKNMLTDLKKVINELEPDKQLQVIVKVGDKNFDLSVTKSELNSVSPDLGNNFPKQEVKISKVELNTTVETDKDVNVKPLITKSSTKSSRPNRISTIEIGGKNIDPSITTSELNSVSPDLGNNFPKQEVKISKAELNTTVETDKDVNVKPLITKSSTKSSRPNRISTIESKSDLTSSVKKATPSELKVSDKKTEVNLKSNEVTSAQSKPGNIAEKVKPVNTIPPKFNLAIKITEAESTIPEKVIKGSAGAGIEQQTKLVNERTSKISFKVAEVPIGKTSDKSSDEVKLKPETKIINSEINTQSDKLIQSIRKIDNNMLKQDIVPRQIKFNPIAVDEIKNQNFELLNLSSAVRTIKTLSKPIDQQVVSNAFELNTENSFGKEELFSKEALKLNEVRTSGTQNEIKVESNSATENTSASSKDKSSTGNQNEQNNLSKAADETDKNHTISNSEKISEELKNINITQPLETAQTSKSSELNLTAKQMPQIMRDVKAADIYKELYKIIEKKERQSISFQVIPKKLGRVKVVVDLVDQMVQTKIEVENESAKQLLQNNMDALKQSLHQSGIQLSNYSVSLSSNNNKAYKPFNSKKKDTGKDDPEKTNNENMPISGKKMGYNTYEYLI